MRGFVQWWSFNGHNFDMGQSLILNGATSTIKKKKTIKNLDWGKILFKNWIIILKNFKHQKTEKPICISLEPIWALWALQSQLSGNPVGFWRIM